MARRKPLKYRGASCTKDCGGHKAGFAYGTRGGRKMTSRSTSFNRGVRMAIKATKARVKRTKR